MSYMYFSDTYLPHPDGVANSVAWSVQALRDLGKEVVLVRPDDNGARAPDDILQASARMLFRDYRVSWPSYITSSAGWFRTSGIDARTIDVIHVHSLGPIGMLGLRCAWSMSIPSVLSWHTDLIRYASIYPEVYLGAVASFIQLIAVSPSGRGVLRGVSLRGIIRKILESVDEVVAPSIKAAAQLSELSPTSAVSIVPTGLPEYAFQGAAIASPGLRRNLGIRNDEKIILFVGRLSAEKNPGLLVRTIRIINSTRRRIRCVTVGDPRPGREGRLWRTRLQDLGVYVLPAMMHAELLQVYREADLLLVTSLTETQGLTVLEARAAGLPVVCADAALAFFEKVAIPGVQIAKTASPVDIAQACIKVLDRTLERCYSPINSANNYSELSANVQVLKLIELYDRVTAKRSYSEQWMTNCDGILDLSTLEPRSPRRTPARTGRCPLGCAG
jgi:1,2-diacylglycerol 3-alpha-glucosyltransferase